MNGREGSAAYLVYVNQSLDSNYNNQTSGSKVRTVEIYFPDISYYLFPIIILIRL
jgi:hypothetical protein